MSDIKIQTSASDQLEGGQELKNDGSEQKARCGFSGSQVFPLSGKSGVNVEGSAARPISPAANNREAASVSGMAVNSPVAVSAKPVDRRTIEGSYPGDTRAKAAPAVMPNMPAPRTAVGQASLNSRLDAIDK